MFSCKLHDPNGSILVDKPGLAVRLDRLSLKQLQLNVSKLTIDILIQYIYCLIILCISTLMLCLGKQ